MAIPPAEHHIDEALVRRLLGSQCPDLAELPLQFGAAGWDNQMVRVGDRHVARLPRRTVGDRLVLHEQRWLPEIAPRLPLPVPTPLVSGVPEHGYPWHWSVCPWLPGTTAAVSPPDDEAATADTLAAFLMALHHPAPVDAPTNEFRGVPLATRAEAFESRLSRLGDDHTSRQLHDWWVDVAAIPAANVEPVLLHGDLHPANLLVHDGRLAAVVDFGDICGGDPATDLAVAWMLFGHPGRDRFFSTLGTDPGTRRRAAGWAAVLALAFLADDGGPMTPIGRRTIDALLTEFC